MQAATPNRQEGYQVPVYAIALAIFAVALLTRAMRSDVPINVDEAHWLRRGIAFYRALMEGNLDGTYLRHHPGVTNMWLVGGGLSLHYLLQGAWPFTPTAWYQATLLSHMSVLELFIHARTLMMFTTAASIAAFYLLSRRLFGPGVALIAALFLLLEPFFLAYQRFITTDANQANFGWLAFLAFLLYLHGRTGQPVPAGQRPVTRPTSWLLASGVLFGLAMSSKISVLLTLPAMGLWALVTSARAGAGRRTWLWLFRDLAIWGATVACVIFLLWPALWVDLPGTVTRFLAGLEGELQGHRQFYLGEPTLAPGAGFYPLVLLFRLTPLLQASALLGLISLVVPALRRQVPNRSDSWAVALNVLLVTLAMTASATKIDRYIVPLIPGLAIMAATGLWANARLVTARWQAGHRAPQVGLAATLVLILIVQSPSLLGEFPYYVTYYNPLAGGASQAEKMLMLGNGELLDQAAGWLNRQPDAANSTAASWYVESFLPYFQGTSVNFERNQAEPSWRDANYAVIYVNQRQRDMPSTQELAYFGAQQPLHVVGNHGVDYALIYPGPMTRPADLDGLTNRPNLQFTGFARLAGYEQTPPQAIPGDPASVVLYWQVTQPLEAADLRIRLQVLDQDGKLIGESEAPPVAGLFPVEQWPPGQTVRDVHQINLPPDAEPGSYRLAIGVYREQDGRWLEIRDQQGPIGTIAPLANLNVAAQP